jgi:predicted RNA methylase
MTARRPPDFELAQAVRSRGFTPRLEDAPGLVEIFFADEGLALDVERALCKLGPPAVDVLLHELSRAPTPRLPRLCGAVARTVGDPAALSRAAEGLVSLLPSKDGKLRRQAISALGKLGTRSPVEGALVDLWHKTQEPADLRALAAALGQVGGERARQVLTAVRSTDAELVRLVGRSLLVLERTQRRDEVSRIDERAVAPCPLALRLFCREGLERLLVSELEPAWAPEVLGPGRVRIRFAGPLADLFRARLFLHVGFELVPVSSTGGLEAAVVRALSSPEARRVLSVFTEGAWRYRLAWAAGGHRRALVWRLAQGLSQAVPELQNDPTESTWEAVVAENQTIDVVLVPKKLDDPRFVFRERDVPAASHPTLAAALVRAGGVRADDVVWDPFVGSGTELIERALLGSFASLIGSDTDLRALEVARGNLDAARVTASLHLGDALRFAPAGVTAIITNPPMGRRVHRGDVGPLLDAFAAHAARVLAKGGRLAWISPLPERTAAVLSRAGLLPGLRQKVDMGGFFAELQVWHKRT